MSSPIPAPKLVHTLFDPLVDRVSYSQHGEDEFLVDYFRGAAQGTPLYIDIGAADGLTFSNTFRLAKELGAIGVNVEPSPWLIPKLIGNHRRFGDRSTVIGAAVVPVSHVEQLIPWCDSQGDLVSTTDRHHEELWGKAVDYQRMCVPAIQLKSVVEYSWEYFAHYGARNVYPHFVSLDVEGTNAELFDNLMALINHGARSTTGRHADFKPMLICVESEPSKPHHKDGLVRVASQGGYKLLAEFSVNLMFEAIVKT